MVKFFSESDCDSWAKDGEPRISIKKANRLIQERSKVVYGVGNSWVNKLHDSIDTHQALLICVEEIEKDSAEKVLVDLIEVMSEATCWSEPFETLKNRAKRLLEGK